MQINVLASSSKGNASVISDGSTTLLLDAGIPYTDLCRKSGYRDMHGCFITHSHLDHSKAIKDLAKRGIDVFTGQGAIDSLKVSGHRYHTMKPLDWVKVGTFEIMAFDVIHDAVDPLGFFARSNGTGESVLYFSDTAYVKYRFTGVTHLICECNHGEYELRQSVRNGIIVPELAVRIVKNHLSVERLIEFLKCNDISRLKEVHLIHLSDNNSNEKRFKTAIQAVTGAEIYVH